MSAQKQCPKCGEKNPAEAVMCWACYTSLSGGAMAAPPASVSIPSAGVASVSAAAPDATPTTAVTAGAPASPPDVALADLSDASGADASQVVAAGDTTSAVTPDPGMAAATATASADPSAAVIAPDTSGAASTQSAPDTQTAPDTQAAADTQAGAPSATVTPVPGGGLQPGAVKLTVEQGMSIGKQFVLGDIDILVGREDEDESIFPDIDLSDQDEGYVHRRHATMRFENGQLMVTHLGGVNKTRINNRPIPDDTPEAVNIGDKLSFGKVVLRVGSI